MALLFIAGFLIVDVEPRILRAVSIVVAISLFIASTVEVIKQYPSRSPLPAQWPIAAALEAGGLRGGDGIAGVGTMIGHYWPRLMRARVVAEVPQSAVGDFWNATPATRRRVFDLMQRSGAKVIVGGQPDTCAAEAWTRIPGTETWYLFLDRR